MVKSDLHLHPLDHIYYFGTAENLRDLTLTEEDEALIRQLVDWCATERKLSQIAVTDHDMTASAIYARKYALEQHPEMQVIIGAECELIVPHNQSAWGDRVHVLCYGLERLPRYDLGTPLPEFVERARAKGAYLVMAHPVKYQQVFERFGHLFDGYEAQSGTRQDFDSNNSALRKFSNSDFHYREVLPDALSPGLRDNPFLLNLNERVRDDG